MCSSDLLGADLQQEGGHGSENSCRACRESMEWLAVRRAGAQAQGAGLPSGLMRCSHRERPSAKAFARFSPSPTGFVMTMTPAAGGAALRAGSDQGENKAPAVANGRTAAETLKANSGHLHGPLAREVAPAADQDPPAGFSADHFSKDAVSILKFHGSYQQFDREKQAQHKERDWQMMLRLRSPAGRIPAPLFLALDDLCERYGNSTLRATTRQAFQMHGVSKIGRAHV